MGKSTKKVANPDETRIHIFNDVLLRERGVGTRKRMPLVNHALSSVLNNKNAVRVPTRPANAAQTRINRRCSTF